jgi:hypothetical protein
MLTVACRLGYGPPFATLDQARKVEVLHWSMGGQGFAIFAPTWGRTSFCISLLRITGLTDRYKRTLLYFVIISQWMVNTAAVIVVYAQCGRHMEALWDQSLIFSGQVKCWDLSIQSYVGYFQGCK